MYTHTTHILEAQGCQKSCKLKGTRNDFLLRTVRRAVPDLTGYLLRDTILSQDHFARRDARLSSYSDMFLSSLAKTKSF